MLGDGEKGGIMDGVNGSGIGKCICGLDRRGLVSSRGSYE